MATTVTIGGAAATDVTVASATELTAVVPAGTAGAVDVVVTTSEGDDTLTDGYTYVAEPTIGSMTPDSGPQAGGTTVTIADGGPFIEGETTVTVGGVAATDVTIVDDTTLTFVTPAGTGSAFVVVTTPGGSSGAEEWAFTYEPAVTVTAIDPTSGPLAGGNTVTITGTGFETA